MRWSMNVAKVAGIPIKVHVTFFLIVAMGAFYWGSEHGSNGAIFGALLIVLLFVCVTLHELGHSLVARLFGVPVREIVLLPLGGVAWMERPPQKPLHELLIAVAGPLVNVFIIIGLVIAIGIGAALGMLDLQGITATNMAVPSVMVMLQWLLGANVVLVLFNLLPAFPLDGGRMLRAVLAMLMEPRRATFIATRVGQFIAIAIGVVGLFTGNILLALTAVIIFFGAGQEHVADQARSILSTRRAGDVYNKHAITLTIGDRVSTVANYLLTSYQSDFVVIHGQQPIGIVSRHDVLQAMASDTRDRYVQEIMRRTFASVPMYMTLDAVQQKMTEQGVRVVAVYDGPIYLGLLSIEDLAEACSVIMVQQRQEAAKQVPQT
jgi:Zn-dependent protease